MAVNSAQALPNRDDMPDGKTLQFTSATLQIQLEHSFLQLQA